MHDGKFASQIGNQSRVIAFGKLFIPVSAVGDVGAIIWDYRSIVAFEKPPHSPFAKGGGTKVLPLMSGE